MAQYPLLVSYWTPTTDRYYERAAQRLEARCRQFGVACSIERLDDLGAWRKNCRQKPGFLRDRLRDLQRPIMWVDVDLELVRRPPIEDVSAYDVGLVASRNQYGVLAGLIVLWPRPGTFRFLDAWIETVQKSELEGREQGDHSLMVEALRGPASDTAVCRYPAHWCAPRRLDSTVVVNCPARDRFGGVEVARGRRAVVRRHGAVPPWVGRYRQAALQARAVRRSQHGDP